MGRARIYWNEADKQAAYRRRRAGATVDVTAAAFDASLDCLKQLLRAADDLPVDVQRNLRALIEAVSNRDGYRQWQVERHRQES
jgi:hypothetical protein